MLLGEKLSGLRKSKGVSQELLAENSKVSLRTIQRIEAGTAIPRLFTLKTLAEALGVPVEELTLLNKVEENLFPDSITNLRLINFCTLAGLVLPFSNILLTLLVWKRKRGLSLVDEGGRKIISFQIIWTLITILLLVLVPFIQFLITGSYVIGRFPPTVFIVYFTMLVINILFTIHAAVNLQKGRVDIYSYVPTLF